MKPYLILAFIFALGSCEKPNSRNNLYHTDQREKEIISWFEQIQLPNGLMPSVENGTVISLYDNALAALVFIENEDLARAEQIFDFFDNKVDQELTQGVGGFSQFRNPMGVPGNHRWMGDNAWLLIAINHYHARTGSKKYQHMADEIEKWLLALQDADGGLFAGFEATEVAIEAPFFGKNVQSMLKLGRAQGVAIAAAISRKLPVFEYVPRKIKQSICGNGNASKEQVLAMLQIQFKFETQPETMDASDGLAAALCHVYQFQPRAFGSNSTAVGTSSRNNQAKSKSGWAQFVKENPDRLK